jgi:hypothetical protein
MTEFFPPGSEAERRISFFAQSLTTEIPLPIPIDVMPTFTVLTPHYGEKVNSRVLRLDQAKLLSLRLYFHCARLFVKKTRVPVLRFSNT